MLTISITDSNAFFRESLCLLLKEYFSVNEIKVRFTESDNAFLPSSDLVFVEVDCITQCLNTLPLFGSGFMGRIFPILTYGAIRKKSQDTHPCINKFPIIYREDRLSTIISKVASNLLFLNHKNRVFFDGVISKDCDVCSQSRLTQREAEVLRLMAKEYCVTAISSILNKSIKTVSSQKKSAMNKLSITSNRDLYAFLRNNSKLLRYG